MKIDVDDVIKMINREREISDNFQFTSADELAISLEHRLRLKKIEEADK